MTFEDLPTDWTHLPLTTPGLAADVVDLVVPVSARLAGCLGLLLTVDDRLVQPTLVDDVAPGSDPAELEPLLHELATMLADLRGGLVLARGRPGSTSLTDEDRTWHERVLTALGARQVPLVGAFLAVPAGVRAYPPPLADEVAATG